MAPATTGGIDQPIPAVLHFLPTATKSGTMESLAALVEKHGQEGAAKLLGVSQSMVSHLLHKRRHLTPKLAIQFEARSGLPVESLLPDLEWERDRRGRITGYRVSVQRAAAA